ncbi:96_t:CDS:2, partial [Funneliformis geosporum]
NNTPVHIILDETQNKLSNPRIEFLPPNTTTILQPCDAGIIHSFNILPSGIMETDEFEQVTDMNSEDLELERLFTLLPQNDYFSAYEYIHIEDNEIEGELTDDEILKAITDIDEEEKELTIDEIMN